MNNRHSYGKRGRFASNILKIPVLITFIYCAIRLGIACGNFMFDFDRSLIENIEIENFKIVLDRSLPIIETTYNSGNVSISFTGEIKNLIRYIFNFDLNTPISVLNANSPIFYSYYQNHYLPYVYQKQKSEDEAKVVDVERENNDGENKVLEGQDKSINIPEAEGIASSTYFEEERGSEPPEGDIISSGKIEIINETANKIDEAVIKKLLKEPLKFKFDKQKDKVLIYHSHTTESYIKSVDELDKKNVPNWSRDSRYNVVRVGDEIAQTLEKKYGISVLHNGIVHDYPYESSYSNSLKTITQYLKSYPSIKMLFDVHRDGLGTGQPKLRLVKKVDGKNAAKIMFVVGTNSGTLTHPDWNENLKLAIKLQDKLNEIAPGLARPIFISKNRYNHHMSHGALTIEMGGDGNLMGEVLESVRYLAKAIDEVIK